MSRAPSSKQREEAGTVSVDRGCAVWSGEYGNPEGEGDGSGMSDFFRQVEADIVRYSTFGI